MKELNGEMLSSLAKEGGNLINLNHPNIVKFWGIFKGKFNS